MIKYPEQPDTKKFEKGKCLGKNNLPKLIQETENQSNLLTIKKKPNQELQMHP